MTVDMIKSLPNCVVASTVAQSDDEDGWLLARTKGIGGSDVGAICGVSPFSSARQIYMSKTGQMQGALKPNKASIERMHFGTTLEPIVADEYVRQTGKKIVVLNATMAHKDYPWALANVDRLIVNDDGKPIGILECKTTSEYMNSEWQSGEILESYIYQLNWYLWILGLEHGAFACLVGGNKFYYYDVIRNDELINDVILPQVKTFWFDNVKKLVEPELQATDTEFANKVYSKVNKEAEIVLEDDVDNDLAATVVACKSEIKRIQHVLDEASNRIKDRLKQNEIGYTSDYIIKWKPRKSNRVDTKLLKAEFPEVYEKVLKSSEYRVMTVRGCE